MIVFFGPAGAGKSVQGQIMAARMSWRWVSAGQLLRDTRDPQLSEMMHRGEMVPNEVINSLVAASIKTATPGGQVILDGWPRLLPQAEWLIDSETDHGGKVELVVVLEVPREELMKRLAIRGRADDTPEAIDARLSLYRQEMYPVLGYFTDHGVPVVHIDGVGSVGAIHDRIVSELTSRSLA